MDFYGLFMLKESEMEVVVSAIAKETLRIPNLETRNSDSLDFYDTAVWCVHDAIVKAYKTGFGKEDVQPSMDYCENLARRYLSIPTLTERKRDSLDFYDVSVWDIKNMLMESIKDGEMQALAAAPSSTPPKMKR